jgi:hypothetical protein
MLGISIPKSDRNYFWTRHCVAKIFQYGIGANKIKRIINYPDRREEGIAEKTIAVMRKKSKKDHSKGEEWVMYQMRSNKKIVISVWCYPGITAKGKEIFIPDEVWEEINKECYEINNK